MVKNTPIRAVPDLPVEHDPVEPHGPPMSVVDAAERGSLADELRAMRAVLARAIDSETTSPRDLAALTRRQLEISRELDAIRRADAEEAAEKAKSEGARDEQWRPQAI